MLSAVQQPPFARRSAGSPEDTLPPASLSVVEDDSGDELKSRGASWSVYIANRIFRKFTRNWPGEAAIHSKSREQGRRPEGLNLVTAVTDVAGHGRIDTEGRQALLFPGSRLIGTRFLFPARWRSGAGSP